MKNLIPCLIVLLLCNLAKGQATIPGNAYLKVAEAGPLIKAYQNQHPNDPNRPSSYLLNISDIGAGGAATMGLKTYINSKAGGNCYLHVYFAGKQGHTFLAFVGLNYGSGKGSHDGQFTNIWCTGSAQPNCCIQYDNALDGGDGNHLQGCTVNCPPDITTFANRAPLKDSIESYQMRYPQYLPPSPDIVNTTSFAINAAQLRDFLNSDPTVMYLQIYLAMDNSLTNGDHLMIVIVGVNSAGVHRYDRAITARVLNESVPCPECCIDGDGTLPPQYSLRRYKRMYDRYYPFSQ